jgi:hypothetical protein
VRRRMQCAEYSLTYAHCSLATTSTPQRVSNTALSAGPSYQKENEDEGFLREEDRLLSSSDTECRRAGWIGRNRSVLPHTVRYPAGARSWPVTVVTAAQAKAPTKFKILKRFRQGTCFTYVHPFCNQPSPSGLQYSRKKHTVRLRLVNQTMMEAGRNRSTKRSNGRTGKGNLESGKLK